MYVKQLKRVAIVLKFCLCPFQNCYVSSFHNLIYVINLHKLTKVHIFSMTFLYEMEKSDDSLLHSLLFKL
jgi:hypothetical protein